MLHGKSARGIVQLHRGNAQIGKDQIDGGELAVREDLGQAGKIAAVGGEYFRPETLLTQSGLRFRQFNGIGIEPKQSAARNDFAENVCRMTAVTQRAVHRNFARLRGEDLEDFGHHDGAMHAGRGFAGGHDFSDRVRVTFRVGFLVFFLETARVLAGIPHAAFVRHRRGPGNGRG